MNESGERLLSCRVKASDMQDPLTMLTGEKGQAVGKVKLIDTGFP